MEELISFSRKKARGGETDEKKSHRDCLARTD